MSLFQDSSMSEKDKFAQGLKSKSLRALQTKRARLKERVAFGATIAIRDHNADLLRAVEVEIARRSQPNE